MRVAAGPRMNLTLPFVAIAQQPAPVFDPTVIEARDQEAKALKEEGVAIILMSTEPETVLAESDRILVMSKGRVTREFIHERVTKDLLLEFA